MTKIHTINSKILPYPAQHIWRVITDFGGYSEWWPSSLKITLLRVARELVGSQVEVRPYGGQSIICEVVSAIQHEELRMKYSGIYQGTGVWTISQNNEHCHVTYEIFLEVDNLWIRVLSSILPVATIHSRLMTKVFYGLERYLAENSE